MGKWKYINLVILVVAIVFMYLHIHNRYENNLTAYLAASLGILLLYATGHYIFVFKMKKAKKNKYTKKQTAPKKADPRNSRPKVVLKPKPKKDGKR